MRKASFYCTFLMLFFLFFLSCKKDEISTPENGYEHYDMHPPADTSCRLISTFSSDTNYIPHKKNNTWYYCSGYTVIAPKLGMVVYDTIIQKITYFNITFTDPSNNVPSWTDRYFIDSLGKYYSVSLNQYSGNCLDTLLLINPFSSNGDTIYNKSLASIKVVLINKNETVQNIPNCYHISVINPNSANYSAIQYYFKKGVGSLFYHGTLKSAHIN